MSRDLMFTCHAKERFQVLMSISILGIDVNQLRHELTQGIRLPTPEKCPKNMKSFKSTESFSTLP